MHFNLFGLASFFLQFLHYIAALVASICFNLILLLEKLKALALPKLCCLLFFKKNIKAIKILSFFFIAKKLGYIVKAKLACLFKKFRLLALIIN